MHTTQLLQADLNLLVVFKVLAEERNVSRAARRLLLTQPAATRALARLRGMFSDDLLVRVSGSYELTPKGQLLLRELEAALPRLDRLLTGGDFVPSRETMHFRLAGTDYASHIIGIPLSKHVAAAGEGLSLDLSPPHDNTLHDLDRGALDMLLGPDDGQLPLQYQRQPLFEDVFVCVFDRKGPDGAKLTLTEYLEARHIAISIFDGIQTLPDRRLAQTGLDGNSVHRGLLHCCSASCGRNELNRHRAKTNGHLGRAKHGFTIPQDAETYEQIHISHVVASANEQRCGSHLAAQ